MAKDRARAADGETRRVTTGAMAYGPHAVARYGGLVLFVRGAAPDEQVEVAIRERRRRLAYAQTLSVLRPSAVRREPPCPYLPDCGGCPWQHLEYEAQRDAKRSIVREQLRRIAGIDFPVAAVLPSPREYRYRRRLKLRVADGEVGFFAGASHRLIPVRHCLLAEPAVDAAIPWSSELVRALRTRLRRVEIAAASAVGESVVVCGEAEGAWVDSDAEYCARWLAAHGAVRGLRLAGRGWRRRWGDLRMWVRPEEETEVEVRARTFTQVNAEADRLLVRTVLRLVEPQAGMRVLDLYAGAGNLSLPLARRGAEVLAVEQHPQASEDGAAAAARLRLTGYRATCAQAEKAVERAVATGDRFDVVLLDPPRSGASAVIGPLVELAPARIVYVSCDPATLARDLRSLVDRYRVCAVQPIDMFPHTYHIETVLLAELAC
jgi:23S rRNA (uracil1939-C5)-methyltransferase